MRRAYAVCHLGTAARYSEAMERLKQPGDYVLVVRGTPRGIVMSCPDDCGEHVMGGKLSIYPSVWRDSGCRAHFIIVRDRIYWCDSDRAGAPAQVEESLMIGVLEHLNHVTALHYEAIAASLGAIPWEVVWACAALERAGLASEPKRGHFIRR